jgi:hypothetical protein
MEVENQEGQGPLWAVAPLMMMMMMMNLKVTLFQCPVKGL